MHFVAAYYICGRCLRYTFTKIGICCAAAAAVSFISVVQLVRNCTCCGMSRIIRWKEVKKSPKCRTRSSPLTSTPIFVIVSRILVWCRVSGASARASVGVPLVTEKFLRSGGDCMCQSRFGVDAHKTAELVTTPFASNFTSKFKLKTEPSCISFVLHVFCVLVVVISLSQLNRNEFQ